MNAAGSAVLHGMSERNGLLITLLLLLATSLIFLAPALRPGTILLAANLPYSLDPLWQTIDPPGGETTPNPVLGDQFYQFYAWEVAARTMIGRGELPAWNPAINGGQPLFGNGLAGILSPFNLIARAFPLNPSHLVNALLCLWLTGLFTFLYARIIGLSYLASWLAMLVFTFSGPLVSWLWATPSHVLAWFPVLLWAGEKLLIKRTLPWALAAACALALLILSAQPELAFQIGVVWAIYLLCRAAWLEGGLWLAFSRHGKWWFLVAALGLALASLEVLAFVAALRESAALQQRQVVQDTSITWLQRLFLDWQEWPSLITILLPRFLGREIDNSYWYPSGNSIENNAYAGILPLILAFVAIREGWRSENRTTKRWIWLWAAIAAFTISVATALPLVAGLKYLPPFSLTVLGRLRGVYVFAIAILAGWGLDFVVVQSALRPALLKLLLTAAAINLLLVVSAFMGFTYFSDRLIESGRTYMAANAGLPWLDLPLNELNTLVETRQRAKMEMLLPTNAVMYLPLLVAAAVALLLWLRHRGAISLGMLTAALVIIAWLDLLWLGVGINSAAPASLLEPTPPAVSYLQKQPGLFRVVGSQLILNPNMAMLSHLEDVRGYDAMVTARYQELVEGIKGSVHAGFHNYFRHLNDPRLDLFNATYGLSSTPPTDPRWLPVFTDPSGVTVYRSDTALPRAYLVYSIAVVDNPQQSLARTLDASFDPRQSVVLEETPTGWNAAANPPSSAPQVEVGERSASNVSLMVDTPLPALLVLLDSYDPGWRATIDGEAAQVYPANHAFRAIVVPAGHHSVTFTYAPLWLPLGATINAGALLILVGLFVWTRASMRRQAPQS